MRVQYSCRPTCTCSNKLRFKVNNMFSTSTATALLISLALWGHAVQGDIVGFTSGDYKGWENWNWTALTHLGFWTAPNDQVRAKAQANGVKLFQDAHLPSPDKWTDSSTRNDFAAEKLKQVQSGKLDGVFFDYEGNQLSSDEQKGYVKLAQAVTDSLKSANASVFVCVGGRPSYEFRDYDYKGLSEASDFLFIMGYDMHLWDDYTCVLKGTCSPAEASIKELKDGVSEYREQVSADKLVLGLPWYGERYDYVLGVPIPQDQIDYVDILTVFDQDRVSKKDMDTDSDTWKIDCKNNACVHDKKGGSIWFDDAKTLPEKYQLAKKNGLRGVGIWKIDNLPIPSSSGDPHQKEREEMWSALVNWMHD